MNRTKAGRELSSGELAAAAGVSVDTLRYYERRGLLPAARRLPNGYRRFTEASVGRVQLIQRALSMGFALDELTRILRARDGGRPPCQEVRALAAAKLADLERRIEGLTAFRGQLVRTLADWDRRLASRQPSEPARLLESLSVDLESEPSTSSIWRGARFDRRRKKKETLR